jgi:hypothetical protein
VLALTGEQGTAKSTTARLLRRLVDPRKALLRSRIRNFDDLSVSLQHQHVLGLDNLSSISKESSDELAVIATGGGSEKRALYSDDDVHTIDVCKPIVFTAIPLVIEGGDLLERAMVVRCPVISEAQRRTEADIEAAFTALWPRLLGALADAVSGALRALPTVQLPGLPRMADHVRWVTAAESALGWDAGTYYQAFTGQQQDAITQQVDDDPVAARLIAHLNAQPGEEHEKDWQGTAGELLEALSPEKPGKDWPRSPRALSAQLDRLAPSLRRMQIFLTRPDRRRKGRNWRVTRKTGTTGTTGTKGGFAEEKPRSAGAGLPQPTGTDQHQPAPRPAPTGTDRSRPAPRPAPANPQRGQDLRAVPVAGAGGAGLAGISDVCVQDDEVEVSDAANF